MTQVKFKHRDGFDGPNDKRIATGTYHKDGTFTVEIPSKYAGEEPETLNWWTPVDAQRLFDQGFWIKMPSEVFKFVTMQGRGTEVYTGDFTKVPGQLHVSWTYADGTTGDTTYREEIARQYLDDGDWVVVNQSQADHDEVDYTPEPVYTDIEKARVLIGEQNLMVIMNGDNYQVEGFNSYKAKNDAELLKICQLLEELKQYE